MDIQTTFFDRVEENMTHIVTLKCVIFFTVLKCVGKMLGRDLYWTSVTNVVAGDMLRTRKIFGQFQMYVCPF